MMQCFMLLSSPQDGDGDTALHCAVLAQKNESVSILLAAGADPTRINFRFFTPIHEAARIGFLPYVVTLYCMRIGGKICVNS